MLLPLTSSEAKRNAPQTAGPALAAAAGLHWANLDPYYSIAFYFTAGFIVAATGLAITRRNVVHAVVNLILSFLGSAVLFYLLGAPFLAALEVIIYAGAIMVLVLFVIMIAGVDTVERSGLTLRRWAPAAVLGLCFVVLSGLTLFIDPQGRALLDRASVPPKGFGQFVFQDHWFAVEILSLILLVALVAAVELGRGKGREAPASEDPAGRPGRPEQGERRPGA
ncbi:MAG: NADH-quinone oxidoreductase subunit J [Thermodesulfobacteriota bacterium]